jgi:predicted ATP-grasp superfamily ATP-dependent carboligase
MMPQGSSVPRVAAFGVVPTLTWSVTRSLMLAGLHPVVFGWHRLSPLRLLPGCTYVPLRGVKWTKEGELDRTVVAHLNEACRTHRVDQILAVDFPSVSLLARHGSTLTSAQLCALPNPDTLQRLHNKWEFYNLAKQLNIPQPRTELARSVHELLHTELKFPIITKPVDRWASVGFQRHDTPDALVKTLAEGSLTAEYPVLVQEFIPGRDVGFAFIARHGKLVAHAAFEQPRKRYRRYYNAPTLARHVEALVARTGYHGVGEVDARFDPVRDEYRLLEVNPRFWASMLYATRAGMNFPEMLLKLDRLADEAEYAKETKNLTLPAYDFIVSKSMQLSEKFYNIANRWRGI